MTSKLILTIFLLSSNCILLSGQSEVDFFRNLKWENRYLTEDKGMVRIAQDTISLDSISLDKYEYKRFNTQGNLIENIKIEPSRYCRSNTEKPSGKYYRMFSSGQLAQTGNLICAQKAGEWFEFYESGSIKKYEHYLALEQSKPLCLQEGLYKEYHPNGKTKIRGQYQIFESYETETVFDYETYEEKEHCCTWQFTSKKVEQWIELDSLGQIIKDTLYTLKPDGISLKDYPDRLIKQQKE